MLALLQIIWGDVGEIDRVLLRGGRKELRAMEGVLQATIVAVSA